MHQQIKLKTLQAIIASVVCFGASNVLALSGGFGSTTSGGSSSGSTVSGCVSIGGATAGSSLSGGFINTSGTGGESCSGQDSDGDHMKDTWEMTYGLNKYNATDAYGDADSDGSSNVREAYMGTKPSGPGSTDTDGDGVNDSDDAAPDNPAITTLTVDGTYKGKEVKNTDSSN